MVLKRSPREIEFIALMAFLMANVAMSIDAVLPALPAMGISIHHTDSQDLQLLITMIFLGLGFGQLIFGPVSDSLGRKKVVYIGFALFILASAVCVSAENLETMVIGRILQGIGLAAPRTVSIAMIRDCYSGDYMARIMSYITVIFIMVPVIAPALGKFVLDFYNWKAIFYVQLLFTSIVLLWFGFRQKETLDPEHKIKLNTQLFFNGFRAFIKETNSLIYTLISGFIVGGFMVYISASQHIFQMQYGLVDEFPFLFAALAIFVGFATYLNGSLVLRFGMKRLATIALLLFSLNAALYLLLFSGTSNPSIWVLMFFFSVQFFTVGFCFGNLRALAMEPIGHIAGMGAALNGFISTVMAVPIGMYIGSFIDQTTLPLFWGFLCCGACSYLLIKFVAKD